jgi:iron complex transport system ATP-binding protein
MWSCAKAALDRIEAGHLALKLLTDMSAGERRRILIARALVTNPEVLLLDEPTTGLDFVARHRFMESVRRLAIDGATILLVTHHVDEVIPEMQRVILLSQGRVAHDGRSESVLTRACVSEAYGAPVMVERNDGYFHIRVGGVGGSTSSSR